MKKITLFFLLLTVTFSVQAQFPEGFETAVPPSGWASFIGTNGEGTGYDWTTSTTAASGSQAAYVRYEGVANSAEDWLVTPQFTPSAAANIFTFKQRQAYGSDYGTTYTIRVSTTSQTTHADFTTIDTQAEGDFGTVYSTHNVDLSAYNGTPIYVAFVMENNNGDNWYVDDVDLIANASAPNCATNPTPADAATDVAVTGGAVTIAWDAPTTGDAATGYEVFWGETSGSLSSLGTLSDVTVNITNINYSTTYYWMIVPQNVGGSATGCVEWSFTTEAAPPPVTNDTMAGAIPITPSAAGTGCSTATFTLDFASDTTTTTDSGMDGTCNTTDTGLDQFFTWTATTDGLLFNDASPGNPGIIIRDTSGNQIACAATFASDDSVLSGWTIGDDLIIQIYDYATTGAAVDVAFCLEEYTLPSAPVNDDCSGAVSLTVNADLNCTSTSAGTLVGATDSGVMDNGSGTPNDDVWYSFVATSENHTIEIQNASGNTTDLVNEVLSGSCTSLTSVSVSDPNTNAVNSLTIGDTYYVRVFSYGTTGGRDTTFDVCVGTPPPPPSNDDCANAAGVGALPFNITGDATSASNTGGFLAPSGCGSMNDGVWYTFTTVDAGTVDIALTGVTGWDPEIAIYSGSCGTFTCVDNADVGSSGTGETLTGVAVAAGTQYWINIGYFSGTTDGSEGPYTLDISSPDTATVLKVESNGIENFSLFPTIVKDNLSFNSQEEVDAIIIYNLMGQEVLSRNLGVMNASINVATLSSGMYIVKVKAGDALGSYKIIKE